MGKARGFLEYPREVSAVTAPLKRLENYDEFHEHLSPEKRKQQSARCMDCGVPFCQSGMILEGKVVGCPLHNLIPEWNDLLYRGNLEAAYRRLKKTNIFPEFTSRVCPAPCEIACTCGHTDAPITIRENEYAIIEHAYEVGYAKAKKPSLRTGKKVAIIGAGPAGLAAADTLNKRGHLVTVFEREDRVGGLLMYGIPNMKLEKHVIERKVAIMAEEGVIFATNSHIDDEKKATKLLSEFHKVILACGATKPRDILAKGRDAKGIFFAVDFLTSTTKSLLDHDLKEGTYLSAKGKNVVVVGGGDTGNDCIATSLRHGAKSVVQLEMMPQLAKEKDGLSAWPYWPKIEKTDYGQEEAIAIFGKDPRVYETTVKEYLKDETGNLKAIVTVKVAMMPDEETGAMKLGEVAGSEKELPCDLLLLAAGFVGSHDYVAKAFGLSLNQRNNVETLGDSFETKEEKVYVAGDMRRGQSLVVWAIREGREVARAVDLSLMGYSNS